MQNKPEMNDVMAVLPNVRLIEEADEGGFKVVYKAEVNGLQEAVKVVWIPVDASEPGVEEENRRRLYRELDLLRKCQTPYLVKLGQLDPANHQIGTLQYVCYSEEWLEGHSLKDQIQSGYRPSMHELAKMALCLLSAIEELSQHKAIHRDIKPGNVIVTGNPERPFVLLDLGIAFVVNGTNLTRDSQMIVGTRAYLAPEMLDLGFRQSLDYRADLYTTGLTLYEYACGSNPFVNPGDPPVSTLYRIKHENPRPLSSLRPDLEKSFCAMIDQLLKKLPALRPANIAQLIRRMEGYR